LYGGLARGGGTKHLSWYVYFGVIPPEYFADIEFRGEDGKYGQRAELVPVGDAA